MWIAGTALCSLVAAGVVAIAPSISASYANVPDNGPSPGVVAGPTESARTDAEPAAAPAERSRRDPACLECGVVASIRQIERSGGARRQDGVDAGISRAVAGGPSGMAVAARDRAEQRYEITVRFRDGKTAVFTEASPGNWRVGSRVILIGGADAAPG